jgi:hypothetical protein
MRIVYEETVKLAIWPIGAIAFFRFLYADFPKKERAFAQLLTRLGT